MSWGRETLTTDATGGLDVGGRTIPQVRFVSLTTRPLHPGSRVPGDTPVSLTVSVAPRKGITQWKRTGKSYTLGRSTSRGRGKRGSPGRRTTGWTTTVRPFRVLREGSLLTPAVSAKTETPTAPLGAHELWGPSSTGSRGGRRTEVGSEAVGDNDPGPGWSRPPRWVVEVSLWMPSLGSHGPRPARSHLVFRFRRLRDYTGVPRPFRTEDDRSSPPSREAGEGPLGRYGPWTGFLGRKDELKGLPTFPRSEQPSPCRDPSETPKTPGRVTLRSQVTYGVGSNRERKV